MHEAVEKAETTPLGSSLRELATRPPTSTHPRQLHREPRHPTFTLFLHMSLRKVYKAKDFAIAIPAFDTPCATARIELILSMGASAN